MNTEQQKKNYTPLLFAALAITTLVGGCVYTDDGDNQTTNDAFVNADFTWIAPKVSGLVEEVLVADNQQVKAGQVLARIDSQEYSAELRAAESKVSISEADVLNAAALLKKQHAEIRQVQAKIESNIADVDFADHELERYQNLARRGAGTVQFSQQALTSQMKANAQLQNSRAELEAANTQIEVLAAAHQSAIAELAHAKALLEKAKLNLSYTELVAPFDGVVGRRTVRKGAFVQPGETLMAVVPINRFYVTANFREVQLTKVHPGQIAEIAVDTFPDQKLYGKVDSIAPATGVTFATIAPDNATGNFTKVVQRIPVKIVFDASQPLAAKLKVGMSVEASITIDTTPR
ncbi:HlyD family secretion protein [Shewanella sp. C32]|uniref:HlyD family secretion protein n=1 Tax=Shewanella electrica TaxID=515560 RepID=A0ABT2FIH0_9GAMM|nr:HlyD family secretion protein [Shewanella electrica]MCH1924217.1 HlyD family secretion protein [Shewanella electrica]MCS4556120.1 HlyD family secretion protein [Shewanella electrica]